MTMAVKLLSFRDVPDDEITEIRELLETHKLEFYETPAGNWGISAHTLWLQHDEDKEQAKQLLDSYHQERGLRIREEYQRTKEAGLHRTMLDEIRENPVRVIALVALAVAIAYFSTVPFLELGN